MSFLNEHSRADYMKFKEYCDAYKTPVIDAAVTEQKVREIHKEVYKFYYMHYCVENENVYMKETLSDLLSVLMMARQGMIKGAMVILRSSIENFMRYLVDYYLNKKVLIESTLVLPLFEHTKNFFGAHTQVENSVNKLYGVYSYLCGFSHSALTEYQSQNMTLTEISNLNNFDLEKINTQVKQTIREFLSIITYCFYNIDNRTSYNISSYRRREFLELIPEDVYKKLETPL